MTVLKTEIYQTSATLHMNQASKQSHTVA